jgi:large subunit ribosomal protein L35
MGKIKTHKATAKRFSVTKSGKIKMNHSHHRHKLGLKTAKRKRSLRKTAYLSNTMAPAIKSLLTNA